MTRWIDGWTGAGEHRRPACAMEAATIAAARSGRSDPAVEAHLLTCDRCSELHADVAVLAGLARQTVALADRRRLPEAGRLWWKAQLARRWEAEQRAVAPLDMMQRLEAIIGIGAVIVLLVVIVRSFTGGTSALAGGELWPAVAALASGPQVPLVAIGLLLVATGAILVLNRLLLED